MPDADNQPLLEEDYRPAKNDRSHPAKYLHRESCLGKDTNGAVCDCDRIPNPAFPRCGELFWVDGLAYLCSRSPHGPEAVHGSTEPGAQPCNTDGSGK